MRSLRLNHFQSEIPSLSKGLTRQMGLVCWNVMDLGWTLFHVSFGASSAKKGLYSIPFYYFGL